MIHGLQAVRLQELRALAVPRLWSIEGNLEELASLTPVRGSISAEHQGNVLEVKGKVSTIVTLCCDRCLKKFNQNLAFDTDELIWLEDNADETNISPGGSFLNGLDSLVERIDPLGSFDPERWIFEQLSLQLPVVNHCGEDCTGPPLAKQPQPNQSLEHEHQNDAPIDPRWAALRKLSSS